MTEKIGNVTLNLEHYPGTDTYSDGDIEERLLEIVKTETDFEKVLMEEDEWALLYHLSDVRKNVLNWYDFKPQSSLLEIGSGCGALTGLFCEKCGRVLANDLSKRRSMINAYRHQAYDNLEIYVSNFEDLKTDETFDYVTLIGVFEYAAYYIHSEDPFLDMLKQCRAYLKDGGKLFVAIENKLGLKYLAGAREDHEGRVFEGLEGYPSAGKARTFSKDILENMMEEAGFSATYFYYPHPDYKMPEVVYSQDYLPDATDFKNPSPAYDRERFMTFNEPSVFGEMTKDGLYELFANSFLIECTK